MKVKEREKKNATERASEREREKKGRMKVT
jgi:hypothetical protein